MRLAAHELRSTKYSQLKVMTVKQLREQLSIRKRVDGRKDLLLTPPKDSEEKEGAALAHPEDAAGKP